MHPFVEWLVEHHGKADTPVGDFARDLRYDTEFPVVGDRAELRHQLEYIGVDEWALAVFDHAWQLWEAHAIGDLV